MSAAGIVLAAGAGRRFGGSKLLARFDGAPIVAHVVGAARDAGLDPIVVVTGSDPAAIADVVAGAGVIVIPNPEPGRGLSSTLRIGLEAVDALVPAVDAAVVLLGDQPLVRPEVIRGLVAGIAATPDRTVAVPRYLGGGGANPVALARTAFALAADATGDRGLGPVIAARPEVVVEIDVDGANPDVDTSVDLAAIAAASWAARVRRNREQVERYREAPDGADFYATVSSTFRDDPFRTDDQVLAALLGFAEPGDVWLDIGAGAGRYALPIARRVREVIALDPSPGMLEAMRQDAATHGIRNVRAIEGRWPESASAAGLADVALIAHVGYDTEAIVPFVEAMERAARRRCVAVMMTRGPATAAEAFWPPVHGESRVALPGLPAFVDLLAALDRRPDVRIAEVARRRWANRDELLAFARRQTWLMSGSAKDAILVDRLDRWIVPAADGTVGLAGAAPLEVGVVSWAPPVSSPA